MNEEVVTFVEPARYGQRKARRITVRNVSQSYIGTQMFEVVVMTEDGGSYDADFYISGMNLKRIVDAVRGPK